MNAIILAAGFGTRLKPWTLRHPKALVGVEGEAMLGRQIKNLISRGFDKICVNAHHFSGQVQDYLFTHNFDAEIILSQEKDMILDTGGGVVKAYEMLGDEKPVLVHNVDILSNADLRSLYIDHDYTDAEMTLLISERDSTRKLLFDEAMELQGWKDETKGVYRPSEAALRKDLSPYAFSGIYVIGKRGIEEMKMIENKDVFPIMDYFLNKKRKSKIKGKIARNLTLIDIGKPATLSQAPDILKAIKGL